MGHRFNIFVDRELILLVFYGDVTIADIREAVDHQTSAAGFANTFSQLVYFMPESKFLASSAEIKQGISESIVFDESSRRVICTADSDVIYGSARMYVMLHDDKAGQIQVTRDLPAACELLTLDEGWIRSEIDALMTAPHENADT